MDEIEAQQEPNPETERCSEWDFAAIFDDATVFLRPEIAVG
jgi:hypothetical protein